MTGNAQVSHNFEGYIDHGTVYVQVRAKIEKDSRSVIVLGTKVPSKDARSSFSGGWLTSHLMVPV